MYELLIPTYVRCYCPLHMYDVTDPLHMYDVTDPLHMYDVTDPLHMYDVTNPLHMYDVTLCQLNVFRPCRMRVCTLLTRV